MHKTAAGPIEGAGAMPPRKATLAPRKRRKKSNVALQTEKWKGAILGA
jgi:hypothetical protein